jgi:hypothetical protein
MDRTTVNEDDSAVGMLQKEQNTIKSEWKDWQGRSARFSGWRCGVRLSAAVSCIVLLANIAFSVLAARFGEPEGNGTRTVLNGECNKVAAWSTKLHLVINILSSCLLAASNYTMQCLGSPTRRELDRAHEKGQWLDIGIPAFRNIFKRRIAWTRATGCAILAISSLPLHLFYNSTVFKVNDANAYCKW